MIRKLVASQESNLRSSFHGKFTMQFSKLQIFLLLTLLVTGCGDPAGGGGDAFQKKLDKARAAADKRAEADLAEKREIVCKEARELLPALPL